VGKPGKQTYAGNCSPSLPAVIKKGATFTCIVSIPDKEVIPAIGRNIKLQPELSYKNCLTDSNYITTANCTNASSYTTTGTTITQMEAYSQTLYCGDGICSPSIGENIATCPADCIPGILLLTATPQLVLPDGTSFSTITARLLDPTGKPISNTVVAFASDVGTLSAPSFITDANGYATVTITSTTAALVTITASALQLSNLTDVLFKRAPSLTLTAQNPICIDGTSSITATLTDQGGNPMPGFLVKLAHNSSDANSKLTKYSDVTDASGSMTSTFQDDTTIEMVSIQANVTDPSTGQLVFSGRAPIYVGDCSEGGVGCTPPPTGDWVITTDVLCINVTVPVTGRLIIQPGASLTLRGATVNFSFERPSSVWHYNGIYIYGTFNMVEDWNGRPSRLTVNTTWADCCADEPPCCGQSPPGEWPPGCDAFGSPSPCYDCGVHCNMGAPRFVFNSYPGANLTLNNSIVDHVGSFSFGTCTADGDAGVYTAGDNAIIQNMDISNCRDACIVVKGSGAQILNNKIHPENGVLGKGIDVTSGSCGVDNSTPAQNAYISGNEIYGGFRTGIWIEDWVSNNRITGNYIHDTGTGIFVQNGWSYSGTKNNNRIQSNTITNSVYGVVVQQTRYAQLSSNIIRDNSIAGVYCTPSSDPNFTAVSDFSGDKIYSNGNVTSDNCGTCHVINGHGSECPTIPRNCSDIILSSSTTLTDDYVLNGGSSCFVISNDNVVLDCNGHSIISAARTGIGINATRRNNIEIRNCRVSKYSKGVLLFNSSYSRVTNNTINDIDYGIYFENSTNINVSRNSLSAIQGIVSYKSNNSNIFNNYLNSLVLGINSDTSSYINISNNTVYYGSMYGAYLTNSNNVILTSNTLKFNSKGVTCLSSTVTFINNIVTGNTVYDCDASCTALGCPSTPPPTCGTITQNTILLSDLTTTSTCITFGADNIALDCNGHSITYTGPSFAGNLYGIYASGRNNIQIKNCVVKDYYSVSGGYGIRVDNSNNTKIISNILRNDTAGVHLLNSNSTNLTSNTITSNYWGFVVTDSNNANLTSNTINSNTNGVSCYSSNSALYSYPAFSGNSYSGNGVDCKDEFGSQGTQCQLHCHDT
jgi:parallel beta-helix repeat protein